MFASEIVNRENHVDPGIAFYTVLFCRGVAGIIGCGGGEGLAGLLASGRCFRIR